MADAEVSVGPRVEQVTEVEVEGVTEGEVEGAPGMGPEVGGGVGGPEPDAEALSDADAGSEPVDETGPVAPVVAAEPTLQVAAESALQVAAEAAAPERTAEKEHAAPRPPRSAGVKPDDTLATAGRKVLRLHLARMIAAEEGTRTGAVAEDLHKMRVATRRMRAAWRVFDGAYRPKIQKRYVDELRNVAAALGEVRDLDVQLAGLETYIESLPEPGGEAMRPLVEDWTAHRDAARARLLRLLDSKAYSGFVADYQEFVDSTDEGEMATLAGQPMLVRDTAIGRIWLAYEHVHAHDMAIAWADAPALHALRIDAKRLRYALEFFRDALPPRVQHPDPARHGTAGSPRESERRRRRRSHDAHVPRQRCFEAVRGVTRGDRRVPGIARV